MKRMAQALLMIFWFMAGLVFLVGRKDVPFAESASSGESDRLRGSGRGWKQRAIEAVILLAVLAVGGALVAVSGVVPIKASSGHWPVTRWFLNFSKTRSVSTHTIGMKAPPLDDPLLILKGAGHYEFGCRPCHGDVELPQPKIPMHMTPNPPFLPYRIHQWEPEELYYIVLHGIKFTGMPAWPAREREDEAWAVTAFLLKMPELSTEEYRQLSGGIVAADGETAPLDGLMAPGSVPEAVRQSCASCHRFDGNGRGVGAFPKLAGQNFEYLYNNLLAYAKNERHSGIMQPLVTGLSRPELRQLATYYAELEGLAERSIPTEASEEYELGQLIANEGLPDQKVPACADCHGPTDKPRNPNYPLLAGQYAEYLVLQLELFKQRKRGGSEYAHLMHEVAGYLKPEQMGAVARYYESLGTAE